MNTDELKRAFHALRASREPVELLHLVNKLALRTDPEALALHYEFLKECDNPLLHRLLRGAYASRSPDAARFLEYQVPIETDPRMRFDLLMLLGALKSPIALPLARNALGDDDAEMRKCGCYVVGWLGEDEDVPRLRQRLLSDPNKVVRETAACAHFQFYNHAPMLKTELLHSLKESLASESDEGVIGWTVVQVQDILGKRFGLREDVDDEAVIGDVQAARVKAMRALES